MRIIGRAIAACFITGLSAERMPNPSGEDSPLLQQRPSLHLSEDKASDKFDTGMNGDEDMGEDIIMRGKPFQYLGEIKASDKFATGMNGDEDLGEDIINHGPFLYLAESEYSGKFGKGFNGKHVRYLVESKSDEDLIPDITMKGEKFHYLVERPAADGNMKFHLLGESKASDKFDPGANRRRDQDTTIMKGQHLHYLGEIKVSDKFATGMNGDEDLGEDILNRGPFLYLPRNGTPFHYLGQIKASDNFATGMNGDEDLGEDIIMNGKPFLWLAENKAGDM